MYTLPVLTAKKEQINVNIIDIFTENHTKYIIYTIGENNDNFFASHLIVNENSFELGTITDDQEMNVVNNHFLNIAKEA